MHQRGHEKSEPNYYSAEKRRIHVPHNPFQQPRATTTPRRSNFYNNTIVVVCLLTSLIGFLWLLQQRNHHNNSVEKNVRTTILYPRIVPHETDDWLFPHNVASTHHNMRMHPREQLHRTRQERQTSNPQIRIRRTITFQSSTTREQDESWLESIHDSNSKNYSNSASDHDDTMTVVVRHDDDEEYAQLEESSSKGVECEYQDWQTRNPVACNNVHEIDMTRPTYDSIVVLACGGDRCAIQIKNNNVDDHSIVLKMPKLEDHSRRDWEWSRKDVVIMEQLTSSPYVVDIYGYCGLSHLEELGGNNLHDRIKVARDDKHQGEEELSPLVKLKICVQLASAVADMHDLDVAHNDICCRQIIYVDGIFKLNDFNLATMVRRNKRTNTACRDAQINWMNDLAKMRSPEEVGEPWHDHWYYDLPKVDVYMMGNVMFYVLTNHWTFEGFTIKEAIRMMRRGQRSEIPPKILRQTNPAIRAMLGAIRSSWKQNPAERPSSREIANFLTSELERMEQTDGVVRVALPPFPAKFRHTDSDFEANLGNGYPGQDDLFFNGEHLVDDDNMEWGKSSSDEEDED